MYKALLKACGEDACLSRELAMQVLREDLPDEVWQAVREAADRRMRNIASGRGRLYATIGVDASPCAMNCRFCSHGEAWGLAKERWELAPDEVCKRIHHLLQQAVPDWFTLRTTQFYGIDRLIELCRVVRRILPSKTKLIVNTGEFSASEAGRLADAGVNMVYHTYRLREGTDTGVRPEDRLETLRIIRNSPLELAALVEPLGPEHTDQEIVDAAFMLREFDVRLGGCMARIPVAGVPLAATGPVSEARQVRVIAVTRLISGPETADICVHPPMAAALNAGANTVVVETGAIPRQADIEQDTWRHFDIHEAAALLACRGYQTANLYTQRV